MALADLLRKPLVNLFLVRPGRKRSLAEWAQKLAQSGEVIGQRAAAKQTAQAQATLRHITGIERWGQRRLQVALGQPLLHDEYDGYQPAVNDDWATVLDAFRTTRQATVSLVQQLAAAGISDQVLVPHNQFGSLPVRAWLSYLDTHANLESRRIR